MRNATGVILTGILAGVAAPLAAWGESGSPPAVKHEYFALIDSSGTDIDGPATEAVAWGTGGAMPNASDAEGNLWGVRWLRISDGRLMRTVTCEYGTMGFNLKEGPVAGRPANFVEGGYGWPCGGTAVLGRPDAGGKTDGIYEAIGREGVLIRTWRNKEKGGRWWFARAAGGGDAAAPAAKGQSAEASSVKFKWLNQPQTGLDGKIRFMADSSVYLLEDGKVTCLLSPADYKAATDAMKATPNEFYAGGDGTFYLGYYYVNQDAYNGKLPAIWRVAADGKVEPYAHSHGMAGDGDAMKEAGWFCGPHLGRAGAYAAGRFIPADAMLTSAHDEDLVRRIQKGRVSTLTDIGEWREFGAKSQWKGALDACGVIFAPSGVLYHCYRPWVNMRFYRYTGIDYAKPTTNVRAQGGK